MSNKVKLISEEFVSDVEYITEEKENGNKDFWPSVYIINTSE